MSGFPTVCRLNALSGFTPEAFLACDFISFKRQATGQRHKAEGERFTVVGA
jgi:hypothetical protein